MPPSCTPKYAPGFSLVEVMVAIILTTVLSAAIMQGVTQVQQMVYKINVREKAFDELVSYTEFWKAKIAAKQIPANIGSDDEKEVILMQDKNGDPIAIAKLRRSNFQNRTDPPHSSAQHYRFKTHMEWEDVFGNESIEPLVFTVEQLVFL